jgi:hypothetical protein
VTPETNPPSMRPYGRQILICAHGDCAPPEAAQRLAARFRALARGHGLTTLRNPQRVKCTLSDCLGVCAGGPILVVYPSTGRGITMWMTHCWSGSSPSICWPIGR